MKNNKLLSEVLRAIRATQSFFATHQIAIRIFYGFFAALLTYTLIAQCILTHSEGRSLANTFSYFTIQSNVLVLVSSLVLAIKPETTGRAWRLFRISALAGIATTGFVYILFLASHIHLTGIALVYNDIFHYITPIATMVAFLLIEPKHNFKWKDMWFMVWPIVWLVYTMVRGAYFHPSFTGFAPLPSNYPYPFLDVSKTPLPEVILAIVFVTVILVVFGSLIIAYDKRVKVS